LKLTKFNTNRFRAVNQILLPCFVTLILFLFSCGGTEAEDQKIDAEKADTLITETPEKKILTQEEKLDTTAQNILLIGDSQAYFLMKGLKRYTNLKKHKLTTVSWVSASIETFAVTDTLKHYLKTVSPSYVIVTLGTNQMRFKDTLQVKSNIDTLVAQLEGFKTIWIGPLRKGKPMGLNELFEEKVEKNCFFRSDSLIIPRKKGSWAHPSSKGSRTWTDSIASWIIKKSSYPIQLDLSKEESEYNFTKIVLKPLEL